MANENFLQGFAPPQPGPFSDYLDPTRSPYQYQSNKERPSGYMGGLGKTAMVADKFLEGWSKGRLMNYANSEKTALDNQRALHTYANNLMSSGELTSEGAAWVGQQYSAAIAPAIKDNAKDAAKKHKGSVMGHIFGIVEKAADVMTGPTPTKTKNIDPQAVMGQIQKGLQDHPEFTLKGSRDAAVNTLSQIAGKYAGNPNASQEDILQDKDWGPAFDKVQQYAGSQEANTIMKSVLGGFFPKYSPEYYMQGGQAAPVTGAPAPGQTAPGQTAPGQPAPVAPAPAPPMGQQAQQFNEIPPNLWPMIYSDKTLGYIPKEEQYIKKSGPDAGSAISVFQIRGRDPRLNGIYDAASGRRINPDEYQSKSTYALWQPKELSDPSDPYNPYKRRMADFNSQTGEYRDPVTHEPITDTSFAKPQPAPRAGKTPNRTDRLKATYEAVRQEMAKSGKANPTSEEFNKALDKYFDNPTVNEFAGELKHYHQQQIGKAAPQSYADQLRARQQGGRGGNKPPVAPTQQASSQMPDDKTMQLLQKIAGELKQ